MSHTLHREGTVENLSNDYVVMIHPAQKHNVAWSQEASKKFLEIAKGFKFDNLGVSKAYNIGRNDGDIDKMIEQVPEWGAVSMIVFTDAVEMVRFLRAIKEADLGISCVVTGVFEKVKECAEMAGLKPHSVNMSYGIYGNTDRLAPDNCREISTMCGHGFVTSALILDMVDKIKKDKVSPEEAAKELDVFCTCGIFNKTRAAMLLAKMAEADA